MTTLLTGLIDMMINFCNAHIPSYDFSSGNYNQFVDGLASVVKFMTQANFILPLGDIATGLVLAVGLRLFEFSLFCGNWIVRRVCDLL